MRLSKLRGRDILLHRVVTTAASIITMFIIFAKLNESYNRILQKNADIANEAEDLTKSKAIRELKNLLGMYQRDSCNSSSPQFNSRYSLTKFLSSGCEAWTALVKRKDNNSSGIIKIRHGLGCKRPKTMAISSLQESLSRNSGEVNYHDSISHKRYFTSLFAGIVLNGCPGVMQLQDVVCYGNTDIPIWQQCPGQSLKAFAAKTDSYKSISIVKKISFGIARTLVCMIDRGIWHRDLGPSNILYDQKSQQTCIIDLDSVKFIGSEILKPIVPDYTESVLSKMWKDGSARVKSLDPILTLALHVMHLMDYKNSSNGHAFSPDLTTMHQVMILLGKDAFYAYRTKYNLPLFLKDDGIPQSSTPLDHLKRTLKDESVERLITNLLSYSYENRISSLIEMDRDPF